MPPDDAVIAEAREIAERKIYLWENHDKFRDSEQLGEPDTVKMTRVLLQLLARHAGDGERDGRRLDELAKRSWGLVPFDIPTGAGDADVGWRVIEYHMSKPHERTVGEVFRDDPRSAIDAAMKGTGDE
jgi:hypothetical protein